MAKRRKDIKRSDAVSSSNASISIKHGSANSSSVKSSSSSSGSSSIKLKGRSLESNMKRLEKSQIKKEKEFKKKQIQKYNARMREIDKQYGRGMSKALYTESLKSVNGIKLVTKSGRISTTSDLTEESLSYINALIDKPKEVYKELEKSEDKYIQNALEKYKDKDIAVIKKKLGKEFVAKKSFSGTVDEMIEFFYNLSNELEYYLRSSTEIPFPEERKDLEEFYYDIKKDLLILNGDANAVSDDLNRKGTKTWSDLSSIQKRIQDMSARYIDLQANIEIYIDRLSMES